MKARPPLVVLNAAHRFIANSEMNQSPSTKRLTELQKGQLAMKYYEMNTNPQKYVHL